LKKIIIYITLALFFALVLQVIFLSFDGLKDELKKADVAVVLGNKVELDGQPSERLQGRLDRAAQLYEQQYFKYIIVSGGVGKEGFDEAVVMKDYLVKKSIPEDAIFVDSDGYNTLMTAQNAKEIMDNNNLQSVMVISQFYHISRTKLAFKKLGFKDVYSAHAKYFEIRDFYSIAREIPAYYKYLFITN
jgi:vancomycin permeability regulator SanA